MNDDKTKNHCNDHKKVKIILNGEKIKIKSGGYVVAEFKELINVPADYELEIVEDGQFRTLDDDERITICGHEEFVSHVRCGGSS